MVQPIGGQAEAQAHGRGHGSVGLVDPGHLDGLEDFFAAVGGIVIETRQSDDPLAQLRKAHRAGIDVRMRIGQGGSNIVSINPLHQCSSLAWLIVYLGISTVRSASATRAWHDKRDVEIKPQALSRRKTEERRLGKSVSE